MFGHARWRPLTVAVLVSGAVFLPQGIAAAAPPDKLDSASCAQLSDDARNRRADCRPDGDHRDAAFVGPRSPERSHAAVAGWKSAGSASASSTTAGATTDSTGSPSPTPTAPTPTAPASPTPGASPAVPAAQATPGASPAVPAAPAAPIAPPAVPPPTVPTPTAAPGTGSGSGSGGSSADGSANSADDDSDDDSDSRSDSRSSGSSSSSSQSSDSDDSDSDSSSSGSSGSSSSGTSSYSSGSGTISADATASAAACTANAGGTGSGTSGSGNSGSSSANAGSGSTTTDVASVTNILRSLGLDEATLKKALEAVGAATGDNAPAASSPATGGTTTGGTTTGTGAKAGNAALPGDVIDLAYWYLTLPTGQQGSPDTIENPSLERFTNEYFKLTPNRDGVVFSAGGNGVTTKNSHYPRSELREMNGSQKASWSNTSGTHTLDVCEAFTKVPAAKPEVVGAQIHDGKDDVMQIRLEGKNLMVQYNDGKSEAVMDPNYVLGTPYNVRIVAAGGKVDVLYNGQKKAELPLSGSGWYWKVGAYVQSNESKGDGAGSMGEVTVYSLNCAHSG